VQYLNSKRLIEAVCSVGGVSFLLKASRYYPSFPHLQISAGYNIVFYHFAIKPPAHTEIFIILKKDYRFICNINAFYRFMPYDKQMINDGMKYLPGYAHFKQFNIGNFFCSHVFIVASGNPAGMVTCRTFIKSLQQVPYTAGQHAVLKGQGCFGGYKCLPGVI
jgi:hypothetical protein